MKKRWLKLSLLIGLCLGVLLLLMGMAHATFNANNLMDDGVFDNSNSMSATQIDSFLNSFINSCISTNHGFAAPDPTGYNPTQGFLYGGPVSAGQVIYDAAQAYGLNPQVLLATLQKEEGLVRGDGPYGCSALAISAAVGYGCPDSGSLHDYSNLSPPLYWSHGTAVTSVSQTCVNSAAKAGFSQQIIHAAWLFKFGEERSEGNTGWAIIKGNWNNSDDPATCYGGPMTQGFHKRCSSDSTAVYYDGSYTIDGSGIHIDTGATAALYWYTPHFHGNQVFDDTFTGWFGSIYAMPYAWSLVQQSAYTDSSMTTPSSLQLLPGQKAYMVVKARNVGRVAWSNSGPNPVRIGTWRPLDRASGFCDSAWLGPNCNRPALLQEATVQPGDVGTFTFWVTATSNGITGTFNEYFNLVADGDTWFNDIGMYWTMTIVKPVYSWIPTLQSAYTDSSKTTPSSLQLLPGQKAYMVVKAKNTGNVTWYNNGPNPVRLGTSNWIDRASGFCDSTWLGINCNRPAVMQESSVAPGQTATFEFPVTATTNGITGTFNEYFNLVSDGKIWFSDPGMYWTMTIVKPVYSWTPIQQLAYTDSSMTTPINTTNLSTTHQYYLVIKAKNTGNVTWQKGVTKSQVNVGTSHPLDRHSGFCDASWLNANCNRPATATENSVAPGQTGTFGFLATTPSLPGTYNEYFSLVMDGVTWLNDPGMYWTLVVH